MRWNKTEVAGTDALNIVVIVGAALLLLGAVTAPPAVIKAAEAANAPVESVMIVAPHAVS